MNINCKTVKKNTRGSLELRIRIHDLPRPLATQGRCAGSLRVSVLIIYCKYPANTQYLYNICTMLDQRLVIQQML